MSNMKHTEAPPLDPRTLQAVIDVLSRVSAVVDKSADQVCALHSYCDGLHDATDFVRKMLNGSLRRITGGE